MNIFKENLIIPNFDEFNNFNSNEVFLSQSAFSPGPYNPNNQNDCNFLINQGTSNLYPYNSNAKETNFSSPQLTPFYQIPYNTFDEQNIFINSSTNNTQISNSPLISQIMLQFREKLYPLLKKFFMDFAKKLINDEPIQIAVIDLDKTSIIDYDIGCYSFPLGLRPCTKRELYYENVDLFKSTDIIDTNESDLCSILGICRFDLPIFPSAKGLFCGNITLINKNGNRLNINNSNMNNKINLINYEYLIEDFFIDENTKNNINFFQNINININNNNFCQKYFVLIVEKETLFFNLVGNYQFYSKFPNAIIIIKYL